MKSPLLSTLLTDAPQIDDPRERVIRALADCFTEPATASAVVVINTNAGTHMYNLNMDAYEMYTTLMAAAHIVKHGAGIADAPGTLQ